MDGSDAPGGHAGGVLVIGYGNPLRTDDGVGPAAAELLAQVVGPEGEGTGARVDVRGVHQLTPELALDVSAAALVILVDASTEAAPGAVVVRAVDSEAGRGASSHHVRPGTLLDLARELYGAAPPMLVVSVGVADLEPGDALSPVVAAALPEVVAAVRRLIASPPGG